METKFVPICEIIPPHMLRNIAENGTAAQQASTLRTMMTSVELRSQRQARSEFPALVESEASAEALGKDRAVYNANHGSSLPGQLVRSENAPPTNDSAVNEAYDGSGITYDLFQDIYGRDSIDGNGMRLNSTVHFQRGYDNAFWNGQQMVYGDGDEDLPPNQRLFNRFTSSLDVIGHELAHGVTQFEANLVYQNQPGALNESFSDVFGSLVKQYSLNQTADEADWLIGAELLTENVNGVAIRSMKAPGTAYDDPVLGKDPQPGHMNNYVNTSADNGGVHINSGIPNRAFYLTATELGGHAWERAGRIWYITLRDKLQSNSNFADAARETFAVAGELYGEGSVEQTAVRNGWVGVGLDVFGDDGGDNDGDGEQPQGCAQTIAALFGLRVVGTTDTK